MKRRAQSAKRTAKTELATGSIFRTKIYTDIHLNTEAWSRRQRTEDTGFKLLNNEQQNKEPQNDELITSIFEIPCSIFCGSKKRQLKCSES